MFLWLIFYFCQSLLYAWILFWGGDRYLEGRLSSFALDLFAPKWNIEQLKMYALLMWIIATLVFLFGCMKPEFRETFF